jgi:hypothetical protein
VLGRLRVETLALHLRRPGPVAVGLPMAHALVLLVRIRSDGPRLGRPTRAGIHLGLILPG